ncbi:hypothetical protein V2J09_002407 [Rumex salicifolius]
MSGTNFMDELDSANFFDHIDDLLVFPNDDLDTNFVGDCRNYDSFPCVFPDGSPSDALLNYDSAFAGNSASDLSAELSVPYEDIVQLEWLSNFVEDSFSGGGMTMENSNLLSTNDSSQTQFQTSSPISVLESSSSCSNKANPISHEKKARSKRPRPTTFNPRPTIQLMSPSPSSSLTENPLTASFESGAESQPLKKKKMMKKNALPSNSCAAPQPVRKCMHCEITKTPQWRAGPMGPKTLCNACGVRFKTGRLFPEYRPAASPTFVPSVHSNSHKKVLEMRNSSCTENPAGADNIEKSTPSNATAIEAV